MRSPLLPAGSVVAGYRVISTLGEGSTGVVYLAERDGERVALKVLGHEFAADQRFRRRFERESAVAAGLDHRHVVPILEFGEVDGELYLAMRHVEGADLRTLLAREGRLEPARALDLLGQVGEALDEAHAQGLVHRDVKPANILVEPGEEGEHAYLADFGLAKHASSASSLTGERSFVGTIAYVSPEQVRGEEIDGRSDVYSFGCVLHEALAGAPPFDRESELAVVYAHLNEPAPRISDLRPELPEALDRVIRTATAKDPRQRQATCGAVITDARAALAGERGAGGRRRLMLGGALAAVAAAAVAVIVLATGAGGGDGDERADTPRLAVAGTGIALVDPAGRRPVARAVLPERPADVVFGARAAWALLPGAQRVVELDARTRRTLGTVHLPFTPSAIAISGDTLFVSESGGPGVARIDARTRRVTARWSVPTRGFRVSDPAGIAAGAGSVWVARGPEVARVAQGSGQVTRRIALPLTATLLTFANGKLWAVSSQNGLVEKIDPATNRVEARARLHGWVSALTVGGGSVWASVVPDDVVYRLSEDDASLEATLPAGRDPEALSAAPGGLWIAGAAGRALTRVDMRSGARRVIALDGSPDLVRYRGGRLWVGAATPSPPVPAAAGGPEVRVSVTDSGLGLDPGVGPFPAQSQLFYSTCAKLMNYPDAEGAAGRQVRPDAAAAMPTVSPDGRTYTFRIRSGIRFSPPSGRPVSAATFKHTLERTLSPRMGPDPSGLHVIGDVVGARAFAAGRARSVSGIVARGSTLTITLTRPAGDLLARLAMPIFCAVPTGTPVAPGGVQGPIPMAGPYYVLSQSAEETVLERNPYYKGDRPRRAARIVFTTGTQTSKAVALADGGRVDLVTFDYDLHGPLAPGGPLAKASGGRYRNPPAPGVDAIVLNTRRPLFRDARLRRAVNHALDRPALAAVFAETPTDRYVPAVISGASAAHVYPVDGPDLAAARALVGGRTGLRAKLHFCGEPVNRRIAELVRSNLRAIGIAVRIEDSLACLRGPDPGARNADIVLVTFATPELDPLPFLRALTGHTDRFGSGGQGGQWTDRGFEARLARADALTGPARLAALAQVEDDVLRDDAPLAAFASFTAPEYFSARSGCRLLQGAYGYTDLGALCVR